jgi:Tol biopolymer transport system component
MKVRTVSLWAIGLVVISASFCIGPAAASAAPFGTTRISVDSSGVQGNGYSEAPAISSDGRFVAFHSHASNLVAGDNNGAGDVFVHDRVTGETTRVSVDSSGLEGNGESYDPSISSDGRFVAFASSATNLVAGDTNGVADVFVHDRETGSTTRESLSSSGTQADAISGSPSISSDGRFLAFASSASNLVASATASAAGIYVRDRDTGTTTRVSVDSSGLEGNGDSSDPSISSDGRFVAFESAARNLVVPDTNQDTADIYVHDRTTGATTRVSVSSSGAQANSPSWAPSISSDGRFVAFVSGGWNLVAGDTNSCNDVFVRDRLTAATTRVSVGAAGAQGNGSASSASISSDGRYVAFASEASNLVASDSNSQSDIFLRDRIAGATTRLSITSSGLQADSGSYDPSISGDGSCVAFWSLASNLVATDTNGVADVFVRDAAPTAITIKTSTTTTYIGKTPVLSGTVYPAKMIGVNIVVYVQKPGSARWSYSSNRTVYDLNGSPAWQYKYYFKRGMAKGIYRFKAVAPAPGFASSAGFATSTSPTTVSITLR